MLTHEQYRYLLNMLERKQKACEFILSKPDIYKSKPETMARAQISLELVKGIIFELKAL